MPILSVLSSAEGIQVQQHLTMYLFSLILTSSISPLSFFFFFKWIILLDYLTLSCNVLGAAVAFFNGKGSNLEKESNQSVSV